MLVLPAIISSLHGQSQCLTIIPSNAVVVDSSLLLNGGFDPVWICSGDTLFTGGGFHNIYMEPGSVLEVSGGIDSIFVKNGATLLMTGGIHHIFYENFNDLFLSGGISTLDSCISLTFDYSNAPVSGCFAAPIANFLSSDSSVCAGHCINFSYLGTNAETWQWTFQGAVPSADTVINPQNICFPHAGSYDVTLIVSNQYGSDTLAFPGFIQVHALPSVSVTQNGNVLNATGGYVSYQWFLGMNLLTGETDSLLTATQNGTYQVQVTDSNGCDSTAEYIYINSGIAGSTSGFIDFLVRYDSAGDKLHISKINTFNLQKDQTILAEIFSFSGILVSSEEIHGNESHSISTRLFSAGLYFIRIRSGNQQLVQKFLVV